MKALVIEDDVLLKDFVVMCLRKHSFAVEACMDGESGYRKAKQARFDVIILDINLPLMLGTEICKKLRSKNVVTPIIFLTANNSEADKIGAFDLGGDDYLVKPFSHEELIARVKALTRRPAVYVTSEIQFDDITLDIERHEVRLKDKQVRLTPKEFQLLEVLARNSEKVLTREYLLSHVWGVTPGNTSNRLEVCIRSLRQKLLNDSGIDLIKTEYGVGYRLSKMNDYEDIS